MDVKEMKESWKGKIYEGCIELGLDLSLDRNLRERIIWGLDDDDEMRIKIEEEIWMVGIVMKEDGKNIEVIEDKLEDVIDVSYCDGLYSMYLERLRW